MANAPLPEAVFNWRGVVFNRRDIEKPLAESLMDLHGMRQSYVAALKEHRVLTAFDLVGGMLAKRKTVAHLDRDLQGAEHARKMESWLRNNGVQTDADTMSVTAAVIYHLSGHFPDLPAVPYVDAQDKGEDEDE